MAILFYWFGDKFCLISGDTGLEPITGRKESLVSSTTQSKL